jgi:DNA-binding Lrp family transcriptional regulator
MKYDNAEKTIIEFLQGDLPLTSHPYAGLADQLGWSEQEVLMKIEQMLNDGVIRRISAVLRHQRAGFTVNAMIAWKVQEDEADRIGEMFSSFTAVSHCYLRDVPENFDYNLFTMVHAHNEVELKKTAETMSAISGLKDFQVIRSIKELKKISISYF